MKRREFMMSAGLLGAEFGAGALFAQEGAPVQDPVERMTAGSAPSIAMCHAGFRPDSAKMVVYRLKGGMEPKQFAMYDVGSGPQFRIERPLKKIASDFGDCLIGEFTDIAREGLYQVKIGDERSVPFFIRPDAWRRTLPKAVGYHKWQRCGVEVPNVHKVCHLDDARRRDNGQHVDETGGWHDAGDLRKWMSATMMNGFGLLQVARNLGEKWDLAGSGLAPIREEVKWGNSYFLKMQDTDGRVWADVAGGLNGDNSDNHWTDNQIGTADDRYLNTKKTGLIQAMFVALEAMMAQEFRDADPAYSQQCLKAGLRCWAANQREGSTRDLSWWAIASLELHRATNRDLYAVTAALIADQIVGLQERDFAHGQKQVRGYWRASATDTDPYKDTLDSSLPAYVLLESARAYPQHKNAGRWRDAVKLYLDEYVFPMTARSAYRILPYGLFAGSPTPETYRPLAGELTYRYFMPVRKHYSWLGLNSHYQCCALVLATAARDLGRPEYRNLAYRQIEWIVGANPFAASMMTGEGMRNPYPHSRYVGLIPGGIMNGICGNANDEPVLDTEYGLTWRTNEYWSPHVAYYEWAHSVLESA